MPELPSTNTPLNGQPPAADQPAGGDAIAVGTPEWDRLTQRRAELIHKKNRQGLTDAERAEFDRLQQLSRAAIARTFPWPKLLSGEERLESAGDAAGQ
ncbi:MAG TPA: hypothetical protein VKE74_02930 [Gemmataceae bacterium]|nr:hypothetical protein [Gemmataceae bacterium]